MTEAAASATLARLVEQVTAAAADARPLRVRGGGSKAFLERHADGETLEVAPLAGIVSYEPTELVVTARAGTPLAELEAALAASGQQLGFEPPRLGAGSTIGGAVASGLSGPARPYRGSARDFLLGVEIVNGRGERLRFGGQVMKNVAGYDVSRLMAGAWGVLGLITEVSLRVVPRPPREATLGWQLDAADAHRRMLDLALKPWPVSAMACDGERLRVRVSGSAEAVDDAVRRLAPDAVDDETPFWDELRDLALPALQDPRGLWRLSLPPAAPDPDAPVALH
ncbi:MAG: glycolate oxidase subunit GlcE, partial [Gammaproteobacteria bacterium]